MVPAQTTGRFERRETQKATLQRQNVALQIEVAQLHLQVRDLQLALVIEKALGAVNSRRSHLPSLGSVEAMAELRKTT
jgi:hypothetical protein